MANLSYAFFVDFDGTIATIDVCEALVINFSRDGWQGLNAKWERKELSTLECARETFKLFKTTDPADFYSLLKQVEIDPGFADFVTYCRQNDYPLTILSDGYDFYIDYLLQREGLDLPYYANTLIFPPSKKLEVSADSQNCEFSESCRTMVDHQSSENLTPHLDLFIPYSSATCDLCGVCKLELMQKLSQPGQTVVYIGDGYSDFCPAQHADIVFAKPRLYEHCQRVGKQAMVFNSFTDILEKLGAMR